MKPKKIFLVTILLLVGLINLSFASMPIFNEGGKKIQTYELDIGWNAAPAQVDWEVDWDGDGLIDLVIGDREGNVWFYRNTGSEFNPIFTTGEQIEDPNGPIDVGDYATPFVIDYDNDSYYDLIVGNKNGTIVRYPMTDSPPYVGPPEIISFSNNTLRSVYFVTPETGWIVGDNGVIFQTIDGGNTWLPQQSPTNQNINSVHFLSQNEGWAVGNNSTILHYYIPQGQSFPVWESQTSGTPTNLYSVFFVDANNGWAVGDRGTILHYNGSWTTQNSGVGVDLNCVFFKDSLHGWIAGNKNAGNGLILETIDGGTTWTIVGGLPANLPDLYSITSPPGTTTIWVVGAEGTILRCVNNVWVSITSPRQKNLYSVHFIDPENGLIAGADGTVLELTLANPNWIDISLPNITANLYSVFFKDLLDAWIVGDNNTVLFYNGLIQQQEFVIDIGYTACPFMFDLDEDGKKDLFIGDDPGNVWFFKNNGSDDIPTFGYGFRMNIGSQAVTGTSSNFIDVGQFAMPQVADWNGDGTKDLIIGNGEGNVFLFKGVVTSGTNTQGLIPLIGNRILTFEPGQKIKVGNLDIDVGQRAAPLVMDWNKDGGLDLLVGVECGSIDIFLNNYPYQPPQFSASSKVQGPPSPLQIGLYSTPAIIDFNNDHRKDLLVGDENGFVTLFLNSGTDKEPIFTGGFELKVYGTSAEKGTLTENMDAGGFARPFPIDWNNDGKKDLIVGNNLGQVIYFRNIQSDNAPLFATGIIIQAGSPTTNLDVGDNATPVVVDWNNDDKKDLVVGNKSGNVLLYLNTGTDVNPSFGSPTSPGEIDVGYNAIPFVVDYNGDHKKDLVIGDFDGFITLFLNIGTDKDPILDKGRKIRIEGQGDIDVGKNAAPWVVDYDNSCSLDLIVGNKAGFVNLFLSCGIVDLDITKSVDKTHASPQDILTYTIEYGNRGNFNATNVEITDDIPALTELVEPAQGESIDTILYATNTNGVWTEIFSTQATRIKWIRNELLQGNIGQKVGFKVRVLNIGDITNYATIKSDQTYLQMSNSVTTTSDIIGAPDFSTSEKSVYPEGEVLPGSILSFTIKYKNTGNDIATNVVITDIIDPNLCNITNISNNGVYSNGIITWNLGTILVDGGGEVRFEATVFSPLPGGVVIRNSATITAFPLFAWQTNEVVVTIPVLDSESDDWPMFHFNLGHEGYDFREIIRTPLELKWRAKPSNKILSSPIVADDRVYIASFNNKIYTFDAQSGSLVGSFATTSGIDSTPAVVKDRLYGADSNGNVFCWSTNPELKWSYGLGGNVRYSSVAVDDAKLYIGCGKNLSALNASKPELLWTYPTAGEIQSSPAIANGRVYFGSGDGNLYCLTTSGDFKWRFDTKGAIYSSPAIKDGVVYVGSDDSYIYAIDTSSGIQKWRYKTNEKVCSSPAIANNVIFCGSNDGYLHAIKQDSTPKWAHYIGSPIESSPAIANGVVFFGANNGYIYGLDEETGAELWKFYTGSPKQIYSSPAIADGILYIASSDGTIYAFSSSADFGNSDINKKLNSPIGTVKVCDEITYTIKFYNEGLGEATNFKIEDTLNPYLQYILASAPGIHSNGTVTWDLGTIGANSGGEVYLKVKVGTDTPMDTLITNVAKFSWSINSSRNTNEVTNKIIKEIITVFKVVSPSKETVTPGDKLKYTISYINNGSYTLTGVHIKDRISPYLTNISPANSGKYESGTITWQISNLAPDGNGKVEFESEVKSPLSNGTPIPNNTAVFNSNQISTPILATPGTLTVIAPDFSQSSKTCTGNFSPGKSITYVINYVNTGSMTATNVEIWDVVDTNLIMEEIKPNATYENNIIKWNLGQVDIPGSVSFKAKIKTPLPNGTLIKNKATIKARYMSDFTTNEVIGTVTSLPDFKYSRKEVFPRDGIPLNKILTYTINYKNTGSMDAEDVVIIDRLDPHLSVCTVTSYAEVISGPQTLNLTVDNGWTQLNENGIDGNITIVTSLGTYSSSLITTYHRIQDLIDEINNNLTARINIFYDSLTDKFTFQSLEGAIIELQEAGVNPLLSAIKIPAGIYCSGKYSNGTITWNIGQVKMNASGSVTFKAMVIGTPTKVSNQAEITFAGTMSVTNEVTNTIDLTPPAIGSPPTEGSLTTDLDADLDGNYMVYWQGWDDAQSGIALYELQESRDMINWTTLSNAIAGNTEYFEITNRTKGETYYYRLRAMNLVGTWSDFCNSSDGIRIVDQLEVVNPATKTIIALNNPQKGILSNLESGQTVIEIPIGAFNSTVTFTIRQVNPPQTDLSKASPIISSILSNSGRELLALEKDYYGKGTQPVTGKSLIITLPYSDPDMKNEDDDLAYRIYRLAGDHFELVPGKQIVDKDKDLVTAYEVNQLSIFVVAAPITNLKSVIVYPNPFKLREGHKEVKFYNLSGKVNLWIYNIAGELVFNKDDITDNPYFWPIVNNAGERIASGVYIYIITNEKGEKVSGKVAIIK
ncbi:MAG: PQQ-binding-like beta-propeller repeat protein [bacterium]